MTNEAGLVTLRKAEQFLAAAKDLPHIKKIIDIAEAARVYAKAAKLGEESARHAEEIKLKAQRKAGDCLSKLEKGKGGQPKKNSRQAVAGSEYRKAIEDAAIELKSAQRYQQVAAVPEAKFNEYLKAAREGEKEATTAGLLKEAKQALKESSKARIAWRIAREAIQFPTGPFHVIAIDPPWTYTKRVGDSTHRGRIPYPDMDLEKIKALPVADLAHKNCTLWLWATNAHMREAFECLDAWGFTQKTILTWVKDRMGTGDWLRGKTEHCLLAIRGKPVVTLTNQTTVIAGKVREHSRKPVEFYKLVESLCPGNKLEMFARESRAGWQSWGAEKSRWGHKEVA